MKFCDSTGVKLQEGDKVIRQKKDGTSEHLIVIEIARNGELTVRPEFDPDAEDETRVLASTVAFHHRDSLPVGTPWGRNGE